MKDFLIELANRENDKQAKLNVMREYLQIYALRTMSEAGSFLKLTFVGGTALHLVYGLPRFSEDLDFSLIDSAGYSFAGFLDRIKRDFLAADYEIDVRYDDTKTVNSAFLKFPGLMHATGLTHRKEQNLSIKMDVDTKPPNGGITEKTIMNKYFPVAMSHHNLDSLLSGKIHALLTRKYIKGRDYFDIGWILSKWKDATPNFDLLNDALKQTGYGKSLSKNSWKSELKNKIKQADWSQIRADMLRFAENPKDINALTIENVLSFF